MWERGYERNDCPTLIRGQNRAVPSIEPPRPPLAPPRPPFAASRGRPPMFGILQPTRNKESHRREVESIVQK